MPRQSTPIPPMSIHTNKETGEFVCFAWAGGYETRHIPKDAGFKWNAKGRRWETTDVAIAARCDGANAIDGQGFNKIDTAIGKSLASVATLSPKQAALGKRITRKYAKQLTS